MRKIGVVPDKAQADILGPYLYSQGVGNDIDPSESGNWEVWIHADEKIDDGKAILDRFLESPEDPTFHHGAYEGQKKVQEKKLKDERWQKNYRDRSKVFRTRRMGLVTAALIGFSVVIAVVTNLGQDTSITGQLFLTSISRESDWIYYDRSLPEIKAGELWRLVTPIFLHFGFLHLFFNMLWMYDLGNALERRHGSFKLLLFVVLVAVPSNLLQFFFSGPSFGGMSGVVYGLLGYFWTRAKVDPGYDIHLQRSTVLMMGIWFVLCLVIPQFNVANVVHAVGLVMGVLLGFAGGTIVKRKNS